ncbi:hypothetical protein HDK64DRAFT_133562 [Phyllosticta capitalensis]
MNAFSPALNAFLRNWRSGFDSNPSRDGVSEMSFEEPDIEFNDQKPCCLAESPVLMEIPSPNDKKAFIFGHRLPTQTGKATISMACTDSKDLWSGAAHIKLRVPVHLQGYGVGNTGRKVDVFLFFPGEILESMSLTLFTSLDPEKEDHGFSCSNCGCNCQYKGAAEGTDINVRRLSDLPKSVSRVFLDERSFYDIEPKTDYEMRYKLGEQEYIYGGDVVKINLLLKRPPLLITPNGEMPVASSKVSEPVVKAMCGIAESGTRVTFYIPRKYLESVRELTRFRFSIEHMDLWTSKEDSKFKRYYQDGWSRFQEQYSHPSGPKLVGGVVKFNRAEAPVDGRAGPVRDVAGPQEEIVEQSTSAPQSSHAEDGKRPI